MLAEVQTLHNMQNLSVRTNLSLFFVLFADSECYLFTHRPISPLLLLHPFYYICRLFYVSQRCVLCAIVCVYVCLTLMYANVFLIYFLNKASLFFMLYYFKTKLNKVHALTRDLILYSLAFSILQILYILMGIPHLLLFYTECIN